jgi:hypothetical protein
LDDGEKMGKNRLSKTNLQDIRSAYEASIQFSIYNSQAVWEIHNVMLLANTILIGTSILVKPNSSYGKLISLMLIGLGLIIVLVWWLLVKRVRKYADYFTLSAREIEEQIFSTQYKPLSRGARFAKGESVELILNNIIEIKNMGKIANLGRVRYSSYLFICVFAFVYLFTLVIFILK